MDEKNYTSEHHFVRSFPHFDPGGDVFAWCLKTAIAVVVAIALGIAAFGLQYTVLASSTNILRQAQVPALPLIIAAYTSGAVVLIGFIFMVSGKPQVIKRIVQRITR